MNDRETTQRANAMDKILAHCCALCPICRRARRKQKGMAFNFVLKVEDRVCPFCAAYFKVYGKKSHEPD